MNPTQFSSETGSLWYPAGGLVSSKLELPAREAETNCKTDTYPQQSSFPIQQELVAGPRPFYDPRNICFSSDELHSRFLSHRVEKSNPIDQSIQPRVDPHPNTCKPMQLFPPGRTHDFSFCSNLNYCSQGSRPNYCQSPLNNVNTSNGMGNVNPHIAFSDLKVGKANNPENSITFAQLPKHSPGMPGLADSLTLAEDPVQTEGLQLQPTPNKNKFLDCYGPSAHSDQASPELIHTGSFGMISSGVPLVTSGVQDSMINEKELDYNAFEISRPEALDSEELSAGQLIREKTRTPPCSLSTSSNVSSQSSTPSFSSSSSHSRSSSYAPSRPTDWNNFSGNPLVFQALDGWVSTDSGNQNLCPQFSTENINTNCFNFMEHESLEFLSFPLQSHLTQQPLLEQLEQLRPNDRCQTLDNILLPLTCDYPVKVLGKVDRSQDPKVPIFICPKCGKGHTRQSNLLAHLRDTHSKVKKVFCDFPGCTKSYKRVSECRRHKKDVHKIPLPSELTGKVRKPRSTISSVFRNSKSINAINPNSFYE